MVASPAIWKGISLLFKDIGVLLRRRSGSFWHTDSVPVPECGNGSSCLLPPAPKAAPNMIIIQEI